MLLPWHRTDTMCNFSPWALLPLFSCGFTAAGLWLVYFFDPTQSRFPPLIGNAARFPPASCIFSAVMNVSAFLLFAIVFLRYRQLKSTTKVRWLNMSSVVVFFVSSVGMLITGNAQFRVYGNLADNGSYMTFGVGLLYCWMQTYMTLKVNLKKEGKMVGLLRVLLSTSITVCLIFYINLLLQLSYSNITPQFQWAVVMLFLVFFSTFAIEFRHYRFSIECTENSGNSFTKAEVIPTVYDPHVPLKASYI